MTTRSPSRIAAAVATRPTLAHVRLPWMAEPDVADEFGHLPRGPARILKATTWSMQGLRAAWLHESSFRLEVYLFVILAPLAWWLGANGIERALLIGS